MENESIRGLVSREGYTRVWVHRPKGKAAGVCDSSGGKELVRAVTSRVTTRVFPVTAGSAMVGTCESAACSCWLRKPLEENFHS